MQWDLAGSSLGDPSKGSGSSLGARREITGRRPDDLPQECRRLPDWRKLGKLLVRDGCPAIAQAFRWLTAADPPRLGG
ncbi:hypothetical protein GW17_00057736 [Ensete ventricosum]|nr:hypothetical protein GW17_00057736 [Ensete ventricosum]RZR87244.1 hypothetical protein BHM03_00014614 [Ensete ventricosum]